MATAYVSTKETNNYCRLCRMYVDLLRDVLWQLVQTKIPASDLQTKIKDYLKHHKGRVQSFHHQLLTVSLLRREPVNTDFDISLLYIIITNLCKFPRPAGGWNQPPKIADVEVTDDVERICMGRNSLYGHCTQASVSDSDYETEVQNIQQIVLRMDLYLHTNFSQELNTILSDFLDPNTAQVYQQYTTDLDVKRQRDQELEQKVEENKAGLEDVQACISELELEDRGRREKDSERKQQQEADGHHPVPLDEDKVYHIFFSYSTEDVDFVKTLVCELETNHGLKCTYSARDFVAGQLVLSQIEEHLTKSMVVVMILSPDFLKSQFCLFEVEVACRLDFDRQYRSIIPVVYRKCEVPVMLRHINYIDVGHGEDVAKRIVKAIRLRNIGRDSEVKLEARQRQAKDIESKPQQETDIEEFKKFLIGQCTEELSSVKVSTFCEAVNALELFKPLVIREDLEEQLSDGSLQYIQKRQSQASKEGMPYGKSQADSKRQLKCYSEIFYKDKCLQRKIYLLGEPGVGKTTFCHQLINIWLKLQTSEPKTEYEKVLHNIEFVFYVRLRHSQKSQTVLDMIYDQVCPMWGKNILDKILVSCREKCLILLDGLDEWCGKATDDSATISPHGLPDIKDVDGCTFLTTSRPWRIEALDRRLSSSCRVVEIEGLGSDDVQSLSLDILKSLGVRDVKRAFETFISQTKTKEMTDILKIPLMLVIILISWNEGNQTLKSSLCLNYADLLESLIKHSEKKMQGFQLRETKTVLPVWFRELKYCSKYFPLIEKLAKLAFNTLVCRNKENSLVFTKRDLVAQIGEEDLQSCLDTGILSEPKFVSESQICHVSVSFLHKSLQEFLAAVHFVGNEFEDCLNRFCQNMTSFNDIFDSKLIVLFLCGLAPDKGPLAVYQIAEMVGRSHRYKLTLDYSDTGGIKKLENFILQCSNESAQTNVSAQSGGHVSLQTSASTDPRGHRLKQIGQYIIPDVLININTPDDRIQWLCRQKCTGALKSLTFDDMHDRPLIRVYVIESLRDMKQLEKLCVNVEERNSNHFIKCICSCISHLKHLKVFSFHVDVLSYRRLVSRDSEDLLQAVGTMSTLMSLYLNNLNLSRVKSFMFPSQLTSLSLNDVSVSSQMMSSLPPSLTELKMFDVTFSQSDCDQLYQFLSHSSSLKTLQLFPSFSSPQTFSSLLDLSSHINLQSLDLRNLTLLSRIRVTNFSQLTWVLMYRVNMSAICWREFIQSLPQSPPQQLTVKLWNVNLHDERILSEIFSNFTVTSNTTNSDDKTSYIEFHTNTQTITR